MSGSYRACDQCGKRALRFATRCPGCGTDLPNPAPFEECGTPQLSWSHSVKGILAVLAIGGVMASIRPGDTGPRPLRAETPFVRPAKAAPPAESSRVDTTSIGATTTATVPAGPASQAASVTLVARRWTHVRRRRAAGAPLEAVLTPGDTVTADSLSGGWYRVALYGDVLGYAREATLTQTGQ